MRILLSAKTARNAASARLRLGIPGVLLALTLSALAQAPPASLADEDLVTVTSPNGRIVFRLFNGPPPDPSSPLPRLAYEVDFQGKRLIDTSYLGFEFVAAVPLGEKLSLIRTTPRSADETYALRSGKASVVRNHFNGAVAEYIQNGSQGRLLTIEVRAFDDGVAFRYWVPRSPPLEDMPIENEVTQFVFAQDGSAYPLILRGYRTAYEDQYTKTVLSGIHPESILGLPLLVEQPGVGWAAITEADLDEYAGLYLRHSHGTALRAQLAPKLDGTPLAVRLRTPLASPWRVILIADQPHKLLESNIPASLNAPPEISDVSWIRPGKAIQAPAEAAAIAEAIDFAAESGLEYVLIGPGWPSPGDRGATDITQPNPALGLSALLARARQRNVGVWLAVPWTAADAQMESALAQFEQWGVRGVRIDGPDRDDQYAIAFYRRVVKAAAAHRLMLGFRDSFKPDGIQRTWPNVLTHEAVVGLEYARSGARANPEHDAVLAFTRLAAGPMDYTPGGFRNTTREEFQPGMTLGTRAHQLALLVLFESGLQTLADPPSAYRNQPEFEFIRTVPAAWEETRALAGSVGEYVAVARRRGEEWYLGAITGWAARELEIPLSFLSPGEYAAEIYTDSDAPQRARIERRTVNASSSLRLALGAGGGAAVRFRPAPVGAAGAGSGRLAR
jgi:alpha-glucosidase